MVFDNEVDMIFLIFYHVLPPSPKFVNTIPFHYTLPNLCIFHMRELIMSFIPLIYYYLLTYSITHGPPLTTLTLYSMGDSISTHNKQHNILPPLLKTHAPKFRHIFGNGGSNIFVMHYTQGYSGCSLPCKLH